MIYRVYAISARLGASVIWTISCGTPLLNVGYVDVLLAIEKNAVLSSSQVL